MDGVRVTYHRFLQLGTLHTKKFTFSTGFKGWGGEKVHESWCCYGNYRILKWRLLKKVMEWLSTIFHPPLRKCWPPYLSVQCCWIPFRRWDSIPGKGLSVYDCPYFHYHQHASCPCGKDFLWTKLNFIWQASRAHWVLTSCRVILCAKASAHVFWRGTWSAPCTPGQYVSFRDWSRYFSIK